MSRTIRTLFKKVLTAGAFALPFAVPAELFAQAPVATTPQVATTPAGRVMTSKELHQHLAKGSGWIQIRTAKGLAQGTGWILDADKKLMVTNEHVVAGVDSVDVIFPQWKDGKLVTEAAAYATAPRVKATVIDRDKNRDLALIKLESVPAGMHAIKLSEEEPDAGEDVRLIGGATTGGDGLVFGAVAGIVRSVGPQQTRAGGVNVRYVLSNASTNGGNSGSAVVNAAGELVGVHSATKANATNVSMHVSVAELKTFAKSAVPLADPKTAKDFLARGKRRLDAGRTDAGVTDLSAALNRDAKLAEALYLRGKAFVTKGDPRTGLEDLAAAVELDPDNYDYRVARGQANRALGKTADAMTDFSTAIRNDPSKPTAYNQRGLTHYRLGAYADAEADISRAIDAAPNDPVLWANRAVVREKLDKDVDALGDWAKASDLDTTDGRYANSFGLTLVRLGEHAAAVEAFALAARRSDLHPVYLGNMGDALRRSGEPKKATEAYTLAVAQWLDRDGWGRNAEPAKVAQAYAGRAAANADLKQHREAVEDLTKAIALTAGKVAVYYADRAKAHDALGNRTAGDEDRAAAGKLGHTVAKPTTTTTPATTTTLRPANPEPVRPAPKAEPKPQLPANMVGTWAGGYIRNGAKLAYVFTLNADGTYESLIMVVTPSGETLEEADLGTWSATGTMLTFTSKKSGEKARSYKMIGSNIQMELEELKGAMQFSKVK